MAAPCPAAPGQRLHLIIYGRQATEWGEFQRQPVRLRHYPRKRIAGTQYSEKSTVRVRAFVCEFWCPGPSTSLITLVKPSCRKPSFLLAFIITMREIAGRGLSVRCSGLKPCDDDLRTVSQAGLVGHAACAAPDGGDFDSEALGYSPIG